MHRKLLTVTILLLAICSIASAQVAKDIQYASSSAVQPVETQL